MIEMNLLFQLRKYEDQEKAANLFLKWFNSIYISKYLYSLIKTLHFHCKNKDLSFINKL